MALKDREQSEQEGDSYLQNTDAGPRKETEGGESGDGGKQTANLRKGPSHVATLSAQSELQSEGEETREGFQAQK